MKICNKCGVEKDTTEFSRHRRTKDGLQPMCKACHRVYQKARYQANREKCSEQMKAYYQANREKIAERKKAWQQANREKIAEQMKAWYQANREKQLEQTKVRYQTNREKIAELNKAWRLANREKIRANNQRRRARKAGATGSHTIEQWEGRLDYFDNTCVYCGATGDMQKEHQIPLARGGTDWPANLVPACPSCNYRKGTKTPKEFYEISRKNC